MLGQACQLIWCPVGGLVGGCGALADSRKTPNYFTITLMKIRNFGQKMAQNWHICPNFGFIWPNIGIFGTFDPMADQKTMPTRCLVCPLCGYHDFRLRFLAQNWLNFAGLCRRNLTDPMLKSREFWPRTPPCLQCLPLYQSPSSGFYGRSRSDEVPSWETSL